MIKCVIFDIGGTLHNETDVPIFEKLAKMCKKDVDAVRNAVEDAIPDYQRGKITEAEFWVRFGERLGIDASSLRTFWEDNQKKYIKRNSEMERLVKGLKKSGYIVTALSNTEAGVAKYNRKLGVYDEFQIVVLSCDVGFRKPDPEIYKITLQKVGVKPEECVFADDRKDFLAPATKLGMKTIHFKSLPQLEHELGNLGVRIYKP